MIRWTTLLTIMLLMPLNMDSRAEYSVPFLTVDGLMEFINITSGVYVPDANKRTPELLISAEEQILGEGYPVEVHKIYAEDGQLLTLHRIPGPSWQQAELPKSQLRQPILLMHGFLASSQLWLSQTPGNSLPYLLADSGFDVWLGNFRTNYYSRSHLKYSTKDKRFWDISIHEMGIYDLPAKIDHILLATGFSQLVYIGHSMGTSNFMVMASTRPEYNSKVKAAFLLSPIAHTISRDELPPLLSNFLFRTVDLTYKSLTKLRLYEILPRNEYLYKLIDTSCRPGPLQPLCLKIVAQTYGEHRENVDLKRFGRLMITLVAGTSAKVAHHLSQLYNLGGFRYYDHGPKGNLYKYGQIVPPEYPLDRVTSPVYMYYSLNDALLSHEAMVRLSRKLPNVVELFAVEDPKFTHVDFLIGNNAKQVLYDRLISQIISIQQFSIQYK